MPASWSTRTGRTSSTPIARHLRLPLAVHRVAALRAPRAGQRRRPAACRCRSTSTRSTGCTALNLDVVRASSSSSTPSPSRATGSRPPRTWSSARSAATCTNKFFRGYTRKQWGLDPSQLDAASRRACPRAPTATTATSPTRSRRCRCDGYTRMFERMLDHPNIRVDARTSTTARSPSAMPLEAHGLHRADRRLLRLPLRQAALPLAALRARARWRRAIPARRHRQLSRTTTATPGSPSSSTSPGRMRTAHPSCAEYPVRRRRSLLPGAAARERGAVQAVRGVAKATPNVTFVGRLAPVSLLQHGPVRRRGIEGCRDARRAPRRAETAADRRHDGTRAAQCRCRRDGRASATRCRVGFRDAR